MAVAETRATVANRLGLHARPAAVFVKLAGKFESEISVIKDSMVVNGKSIMGVMTLAAERGSVLIIRAEGDDAPDAAQALADLLGTDFGEGDLG